jgi:hypothetical protein
MQQGTGGQGSKTELLKLFFRCTKRSLVNSCQRPSHQHGGAEGWFGEIRDFFAENLRRAQMLRYPAFAQSKPNDGIVGTPDVGPERHFVPAVSAIHLEH